MRHLFTLLWGLALLVLVSGCKDEHPESSLFNTRWMLVQVEEFPISLSSYGDTYRSYIEFTGGINRTTGLAPCNSFGGSFTSGKEPSVLTISQQAATKVSCGALSLETKYLEALPRTVRYEITGRELRLYDASNSLNPLLIFEDRTSTE
ncbi:META domain-containing protein [Hymenobacter taeanensis]|uniref:META domain-containing protein n=1 Tax=Hymenobacter taeanensis TaxID=2735321 RepID=A0A6M6BH25_9BACT|nr:MULTISPECIES: META domain-containing protein [Hymenobacter]QJX46325.1 META domain-containing protein [Hymenobacter taeanensis]UOQ80184.1 META domain-containing protein [Hymenobacter sp. 5414T-23]